VVDVVKQTTRLDAKMPHVGMSGLVMSSIGAFKGIKFSTLIYKARIWFNTIFTLSLATDQRMMRMLVLEKLQVHVNQK
jgi:hypothetical protein